MDIKRNSKTKLIDTKWRRFDEKKKKKKKETHQTKTNKHEYLFDRQVQAQSCDVDSSDSDGATASVWSQAMTRMHSGAPNRPASARTVSRAPSATAKLRR
jgi:uncharacterized protein with FMN-binding domain